MLIVSTGILRTGEITAGGAIKIKQSACFFQSLGVLPNFYAANTCSVSRLEILGSGGLLFGIVGLGSVARDFKSRVGYPTYAGWMLPSRGSSSLRLRSTEVKKIKIIVLFNLPLDGLVLRWCDGWTGRRWCLNLVDCG